MQRLGLCFVLAVSVNACGYASVGAGEEVVLVEKPWIFGHGGVVNESVKAGAQIVAWSTETVHVNMQPRTFVQHFNDMFSNDGVPLEFNVATKLQVVDAVRMAKEFGVWEYDSGGGIKWPGWFGNNLMKPIENYVRQAVRKHGLNETAINPVAIDAIDVEVATAIANELARINVPAKLLGFTVGKATPPDAVKNQRIATAEQQQRKLTEDQRKLAEDARLGAEISRARADNAYRNDMSLSPEQFLRLEGIHMQRDVCVKSACTFIDGSVSPVVGVSRAAR